jgi:hypothetical protein
VLADLGWSDTVDRRHRGLAGARGDLHRVVKIGGARGAWDHGFEPLVD